SRTPRGEWSAGRVRTDKGNQMKKLSAALAAAFMLLGLLGVAQATADPGPNGNNDKGLCTAYFNGQKKGHDKNGSPAPFAALEEAAGAEDGDSRDEVATAVYEWCMTMAGKGGDGVDIGGNPNENGRWTCTESDGEYSCTDNPDKGNGKPA
ncbi:MAG TPA: hypothetical protein VM618_13770, partial [Acidimicrobiia bacterium]|nr:hypothetical protein [Acidimicrobiia bacterium]